MTKAPRTSLADTIRAALEADIASGALPPGAQIEDRMLMERFKVSRTPAREALLQLMSAGLVETVPRQGVVVTSMSLADYIANMEILVELEGLAARLAARRMPLQKRKQLAEAADACKEAAQPGEALRYAEANRIFHELIYEGSCNSVLARQVQSMRTRMHHPKNHMFSLPGRIAASLAEHDQVLAAIQTGDEEGAYRAMREHISSGGKVYADSIAMTQTTLGRGKAA